MVVMGRNRKGFTLIEIVVVMAIIAILATLIVGAIIIVREKSRDTALLNDARIIQSGLDRYYVRNGRYPVPNPYNADFTAYSMVDNTAPANTIRGILINEIGREMKNPSSVGRVCYYTTTNWQDNQTTGNWRYYLWVQSESTASKNSWSSCPNTFSPATTADPAYNLAKKW
ncbi:type II secretion system protein [candidate division WS5 bacterium]|uniref:Type II secretion system protein n=1 Tax=candidate division WS5 bacterium TaxID=2093353 RepID=A0A419DG11_9BACT|nr:MAG: type II secretion system protein [candidate division WS5 bacterium]